MSHNHFRNVGNSYHDFTVTRVTEIPELQATLVQLIHEPTGAQVMHIANDDPENLFCLSFQTIPSTSNGVAHILEHTVLCGSKKYPIKDPFFAMTRRSLHTFMNALTGSDFTCYPAASQVQKDFYNLLEVYLDSVFHPNLEYYSFLQEGHRLEFSKPEDPSSPLEYKGIVFNEMKGALSSGKARMDHAMCEALFPNLTYGINSGGDPKEIPHLTYEELKSFHSTFYHPSRCLFFFYGNLPLEKHLDFIDQHALKGVKKNPPIPPLAKQPRFTKPLRLEQFYPISMNESTEGKTLISFGWLTVPILEQKEVLALTLLEIILMDTDASPLKHALLKSELCTYASAEIDVDISEVPIIIHLKGCEAKNADALEQVIRSTLEGIVRDGIALEAVENALHQLELARSEITGNHTPFGLSLFFRSALLQQHGGNPEDGLHIHSLFQSLHRTYLENPKYITDLIQRHFLDNPHFVRLVMQPSKTLEAAELQAERAILDSIQAKITPAEAQKLVDQAAELDRIQKEQENSDLYSVLPKVTLEDVPYAGTEYALKQERVGEINIYSHTCFTNDIVYADLYFPLPYIAKEELSLLRLFTVLAPQMACGGRSYIENLHYKQAHTGGVSFSLTLNMHVDSPNDFLPKLSIRSKALRRKTPKLFEILKDYTNSLDFSDLARLKEVLLQHHTVLETSLNQNALKYAITLAADGIDLPSSINSHWHGVEYLRYIRQIIDHLETELPILQASLKNLTKRLLGISGVDLIITCDAAMYDEIKGHNFYGLTDLRSGSSLPWSEKVVTLTRTTSQARTIASPVAFIAQIFKTIPYTHPDMPALSIAVNLLDNLTLHPRIREQGGAYGGGAGINTLSGNFTFYSYRDPNIIKSLAAFEESIKVLIEGDFDPQQLEEAKLETLQNLDAPVAPGMRGELAYLRILEGKTTAVRQQFRERLLGATSKEIIEAVSKHLKPNAEHAITVIFAGKELLERENTLIKELGETPFPIYPIYEDNK